MTRSMIDANRSIFDKLANHVERFPEETPIRREKRYVRADDIARERLKSLDIVEKRSYGRFRHLAKLDLEGKMFLALIGFSATPRVDHLQAVTIGGAISEGQDGWLGPDEDEDADLRGFAVCLLSEMPVAPSASAPAIRNVVEVGSMADDDYGGHELGNVVGLFPQIQIFQIDQEISNNPVSQLFFECCLSEALWLGAWLDEGLDAHLQGLIGLADELPYDDLARSVLDVHESNLYLSLYKCLEATYAFQHASRIGSSLGISASWRSIAEAVAKHTNWRPAEISSLKNALEEVDEHHLRDLVELLGSDGTKSSTHEAAADAIYGLRNRLVHYRPGLESIDGSEQIDWNRVCVSMTAVASSVCRAAYVPSAEA